MAKALPQPTLDTLAGVDARLQAIDRLEEMVNEVVREKTSHRSNVALKRAIRIGSQANNGAAGMFEQDDVDNWRQVTAASASQLGRRYPQDLSMGLGHTGPHPE